MEFWNFCEMHTGEDDVKMVAKIKWCDYKLRNAMDYGEAPEARRGMEQILPGVSGERVAWCYAALGPGIVKKDWVLKNWYFQIVMLEKTPESPLYCKEIKPVNPKGNQPWIFTGRTDAKAPILWPPDVKSQLIGKDPDAGKHWKQKEKREAEDEMLDSITHSLDMNLSKLRETVKDRGAWHSTVYEVAKSQTYLATEQ